MAVFFNPRIVTDGLVLCLDAGNPKSYDKYENLLIWSNKLTRPSSSNFGYYGGGYYDGWQNDPADITELSDAYGTFYRTIHNLVWSSYYSIYTAPFTVYTVSFFAKSNTVANIRPRLYSNAIGTTSTGTWQSLQTGGIEYPGGWRRFIFVMPAQVANNPDFPYPDFPNGHSVVIELDTGSGFDIKNVQVERGNTAVDYYETTSTAKNRGTVWTDLSGRGNTGTLVNGVGYTSSNGGSLVFDGVDDYVRINKNPVFNTNNYTVSIWFYGQNNPGPSYTSYEVYFTKGYQGTYNTDIQIWNDSSVSVYIANGTQYKLNGLGGYYNNKDVWINFVSTANGSDINCYYNGASVFSGTYTPQITDSNLYLGGPPDGGYFAGYLKGNISLCSYYNRALSAQEIEQNFNALRGRFGI